MKFKTLLIAARRTFEPSVGESDVRPSCPLKLSYQIAIIFQPIRQSSAILDAL